MIELRNSIFKSYFPTKLTLVVRSYYYTEILLLLLLSENILLYILILVNFYPSPTWKWMMIWRWYRLRRAWGGTCSQWWLCRWLNLIDGCNEGWEEWLVGEWLNDFDKLYDIKLMVKVEKSGGYFDNYLIKKLYTHECEESV